MLCRERREISLMSIYHISEQQFSRLRLAPVTHNVLGYSLFCDRRQDGVSFRDIFGNEI